MNKATKHQLAINIENNKGMKQNLEMNWGKR
jgi:hypothetical protein